MIPGMNILSSALGVIAAQTVTYYQATGRTTNSIGLDVAAFATGVPIRASVQAVSRDRYQSYGLDLQKNYIMVYAMSSFVNMARGRTGDQLGFNGKRYQVPSESDWFVQDGWTSLLCLEIG